jgi:S1-C subfamily serine protease
MKRKVESAVTHVACFLGWALMAISLLAVGPAHAQVAKKLPSDVQQLYDQMLKSTAYVGGGASGIGTASLVDKKNKLLLTNQHVGQLASQGPLFVIFPFYARGALVVEKKTYDEALKSRQSVIPGFVEYQDKKADLALIKLAGLPDSVVPISLADAPAVPGQMMYALGNPPQTAWMLSTGQARTYPHHQKWGSKREAIIIECMSPLNPGDSGDPVVNERGELIAVTTEFSPNDNLRNFSIDVQEVKKFLAGYYKTKGIEPPSHLAPAGPPPEKLAK